MVQNFMTNIKHCLKLSGYKFTQLVNRINALKNRNCEF